MPEITNSVEMIDSRNIQERINELEALEERDEYDQDELDKLSALKSDADTSEWDFGVGFISEGYFEEYARDFAEDIGAIEKDGTWPANCIDWERAARELRIDYTEVDFDGVTYYFR